MSVTAAAVTVTQPGNKKKNKKPHDLVVTINLVSRKGEGKEKRNSNCEPL